MVINRLMNGMAQAMRSITEKIVAFDRGRMNSFMRDIGVTADE